MTEEHGHFERLVVGHVLGDLPSADASRFRSHLLGCRECRARVAELRGIAADLADAERDELARAQVRTETPRRVDQPDDPFPNGGPRITVQHVTLATLVVVLLAVAMAFWNLQLRESVALQSEVAQYREGVLEALADGVPLELELASGLSGLAVADGEQVAMILAGVEPPGAGERLVAWFLGVEDAEGGLTNTPLVVPGMFVDDAFAVMIDDPGGARELIVTREGDIGDRPGDDVLLRSPLLGR